LSWQQGIYFVDGMAIGDFSENISEVCFGVHTVELYCLDEGIDGCGVLTAGDNP
jgi:hypothetical protein